MTGSRFPNFARDVKEIGPRKKTCHEVDLLFFKFTFENLPKKYQNAAMALGDV
ncbi:hypothetical protein [Streptacidiphilus rugosus]|uniref:hypothetical protein n=1 Tax=Streptacidiphilus rugosus TaxID=405783 RepID=UPI000B206BD6|nr:hypothetical protein [Streptacidiphilus rugosus]